MIRIISGQGAGRKMHGQSQKQRECRQVLPAGRQSLRKAVH
jgi:hypothetical protein